MAGAAASSLVAPPDRGAGLEGAADGAAEGRAGGGLDAAASSAPEAPPRAVLTERLRLALLTPAPRGASSLADLEERAHELLAQAAAICAAPRPAPRAVERVDEDP